jgi:hypothetical protein
MNTKKAKDQVGGGPAMPGRVELRTDRAQVLGLLTSNILAIVIPRNASSALSRSRIGSSSGLSSWLLVAATRGAAMFRIAVSALGFLAFAQPPRRRRSTGR